MYQIAPLFCNDHLIYIIEFCKLSLFIIRIHKLKKYDIILHSICYKYVIKNSIEHLSHKNL